MKNFTEMISKGYGYNAAIYHTDPHWRRAKELFVLNYKSDDIQRIPKKLHHVWLGSTVPYEFRKYMDTWQEKHPTWEYHLWTDDDVDDVEITDRDLFDEAQSQAMKSDILRYEILRQFGGLYIDTDFECIKPFDDLLYLDFFVGISYDDVFRVYNGLIGATAGHPILNDCVHFPTRYGGTVGRLILASTGAYHLTNCFVRNAMARTVAFPMDYFYPYPNHIRGTGNPHEYITDVTYAVHYWEVSWTNKKRYGRL